MTDRKMPEPRTPFTEAFKQERDERQSNPGRRLGDDAEAKEITEANREISRRIPNEDQSGSPLPTIPPPD